MKDYLCTHFVEESAATLHALNTSLEAGLKVIQVPSHVAKTLYLIARLTRSKTILEIGTLGGYSALWLAKALEKGGTLITMECDPAHIAIAKENIRFARMEETIQLREGDARVLLDRMIAEEHPPFDLIFIDADKAQYPEYLERVLQLSRSGTVILSDNLIPRRGEIGCPDPRDNEAVATYHFNQMLADHPGLETIPLTTIAQEGGRIDAIGLTLVL